MHERSETGFVLDDHAPSPKRPRPCFGDRFDRGRGRRPKPAMTGGLRRAMAGVIPWLAGKVAMICARCAREVAAGAQRCPSCAGDPLLDGRYRLDRQLANDSIGVSYRATRVEDATLVRARSCMLRRLPDEPERSARLATLRELEHPSLPRWLDAIVLGEGSLAMLWSIHEHVAGQSLAEALAAAPERRFDETRTVAMMRDLADVLAYLHEQPTPMIDGALSPARVQLRTGERTAWLLDLGCAPAVVHGASNRGLADAIAYSAPEQLHGDPTTASDVWALGAIAIVALSGARLTSLRDAGQRLRWRDRVSVTPELAALLERVLEPDPTRRITAAQLRDALDQLRVGAVPRSVAAPRSVVTPPRPRASDVPIMRPDELSRELSQADQAASTLARQQQTRLMVARVLVAIVTALIAGLATWVAITLT